VGKAPPDYARTWEPEPPIRLVRSRQLCDDLWMVVSSWIVDDRASFSRSARTLLELHGFDAAELPEDTL